LVLPLGRVVAVADLDRRLTAQVASDGETGVTRPSGDPFLVQPTKLKRKVGAAIVLSLQPIHLCPRLAPEGHLDRLENALGIGTRATLDFQNSGSDHSE
jgi:hypothetical protein